MAFVDLPDWQIPISISGITIASIPIDIVAQTIGNIAIDIAAQTLGVVNVNIAAIGPITMNVHEVGIATVSIVASIQLNVNIAASAITLNIHETGTANVAVTSSVQLNVNIAASAITLNIHEIGTANVAVTSSVQLNVNIAASAINIPIDIAAQSVGNLSVAVASSVTLNINIATSAINIPVTTAPGAHVDIEIITSIVLNINISSITGGVIFNVNISSITGGVTFNVNITGSVAINVNVAGSVELNIKTTGGANIIIDRLTVSAYTERRSTISNNGAVPSGPWSFDWRKAKFFPRGCRGFIKDVELYLKGAADNVTITISFRVYPEGGEIFQTSYVLGAAAAEGWKTIAINSMWNYDSMFIVCYSADTASLVAFEDTGTPYDAYFAPTGTDNFQIAANVRFWYRVVMIGETCGDVPVSGTINNIEIPNLSASRQLQLLADIPAGTEMYDTIQYGSGKCLIVIFGMIDIDTKQYLRCRIRCDGVQVMPVDGTLDAWYNYWVTATSPGITIGQWNTTDELYSLVVAIPFPFKKSLEVGFYNGDVSPRSGRVAYSYEKIG